MPINSFLYPGAKFIPGYEVANSCRFNDGDSPYLSRTFAGAGDLDKWTFSCWYKRSAISSATQRLFGAGSNNTTIYFNTTGQLAFYDAALDTSWAVQDSSFRLFRDTSAWYHIVWTLDSAQAVAANRVKCYINGTQQTLTISDPSGNEAQNFTTAITTAAEHFISKRPTHSTGYLDGYLAEVCFCDGQAYAASDFGEFDEDSPTIWKPKDVSGLTFGTNGFYLDFEDSANLGNDANGGTDWDETNLAATDQATDTPTNNFCTFNPLIPNTSITYSEGNLQVVSTSGGDYKAAVGTIGTQSGKWYCEMKASDGFNGSDKGCGIYRLDNAYGATTGLGNYTTGTTWSYSAAGYVRTNNATTDNEATFTDGDIIGIAMDLDNNKLYWAKNNTWINSGDPESGATGTGSYAIVAGDFYTFAATVIDDGAEDPVWQANFGSPMYANSSDAADENGYGAFEYAPPSGYYALCTKNLAEYG